MLQHLARFHEKDDYREITHSTHTVRPTVFNQLSLYPALDLLIDCKLIPELIES